MKPSARIPLLVLALAGVFALGWWQSRSPSEGELPVQAVSSPSPGPGKEVEALRRENAALRRQVSDLLRRASGGPLPSGASPAGPVPAAPSAPTVPPADLLARAKAAMESSDGDAFLDACLALLDAGEAGSPAMIELLKENGPWPAFLQLPLNREASKRWYREQILRAPMLGSLADAILSRPGPPDKATAFALDLLDNDAPSSLSRDRQVQLLMGIAKSPLEGMEPEFQRMRQMALGALLGKLKASEALPEVERMYSQASDQERWGLAYAIGNTPGGVASLRRLLEGETDPDTRRQLLQALGRSPDREANDLLWEQAPASGPGAWYLLASRPENLQRILQQVRTPSVPPQDREAMLNALAAASQSSRETREALWGMYDGDPSLRDALLQRMLDCKDKRAAGILADRLRTGQVTEELSRSFWNLDARTVRENQDALRSLASSAPSVQTRVNAYAALRKVDPQAALDACLSGFSRMGEPERVGLLQNLWGQAGGDGKARAAIERAVEGDPSGQVRSLLEQMRKGR